MSKGHQVRANNRHSSLLSRLLLKTVPAITQGHNCEQRELTELRALTIQQTFLCLPTSQVIPLSQIMRLV